MTFIFGIALIPGYEYLSLHTFFTLCVCNDFNYVMFVRIVLIL